MLTTPDFRQTWLWRQGFEVPHAGTPATEQDFFRGELLKMRSKAEQLVTRIAVDLPGMTVHDISHLDALWDTASLISEGSVNLNPAETFVFGASVLLHDAGMSLAAYSNGIEDLKSTVFWKDAVARLVLDFNQGGGPHLTVETIPLDIVQQMIPDVLRRLHAEQAEKLAEAELGGQRYPISFDR